MTATPAVRTHVLTLSCQDRPRIVASVTATLADTGANIAESAQFWDRSTNRFFMRIAFQAPAEVTSDAIRTAMAPVVEKFGMETVLVDGDRVPKIIIMVSRLDHCLQHLLYQIKVGWLRAEVVAIVSNWEDSRPLAEAAGIPFHYLPVDKANKRAQEERLEALIAETGAELTILARYMQVLSDTLSSRLFGRIINIHHSFLPSFRAPSPIPRPMSGASS